MTQDDRWQRVVDDCRRFALVQTRQERAFLAYLAVLKRITPKQRARLFRIARRLISMGY